MRESEERDKNNSIGVLSPEQQIELDEIQESAARDAINFLDVRTESDPFPLIAMATGIGKGRIIHKVIEQKVRENPQVKILAIVGTKLTLVDQTKKSLSEYAFVEGENNDFVESEDTDLVSLDTEDVDVSSFSEKSVLYKVVDIKNKKKDNENVHAATIQTVTSAIQRGTINPDEYDLVIVDEAHNAGTMQRMGALKRFKNVLGFTATPFRHTGRIKSPEQYGFTVISSLTLPEAQEKELLPPLVEESINTAQILDEIPTTRTGNIDFKKLEKQLKDSPDLLPFVAGELETRLVDNDRRLKTVIAVNFVWEAERLAKLLKERGFSVGVAVNKRAAEIIDSPEIPAVNSIERYRLSSNNPDSLQVLISPYVAAEGFDAPETEVLVWASPTDSTVRYTQFTGRTARRFPGKKFGMIIDFLYQTSQFTWSYNFGQWMKDSVVQLPNGMLFQGSDKQLKDIMESSNFVRNDLNESRKISIQDLQKSSLVEAIQEDEYALTNKALDKLFIGGRHKVKTVQEVLDEMRKENPSLVFTRRAGNRLVPAVKDKDLFIEKMVSRGAQLNFETEEPFEGELVITDSVLQNKFMGRGTKVYAAAQEVLKELREENPGIIVERNVGRNRVQAVTREDIFVKKMAEKGFSLKEKILPPQPGDFSNTRDDITSTFIGDPKKTQTILNQVIDELKKEAPDLVVKRQNGRHIFEAITNRDLVISRMVEQGVHLNNLLSMQPGDFLLSNNMLEKTFKGGAAKLKPIAKAVLDEMREDDPDSVVLRKVLGGRGGGVQEGVLDHELFIKKMQEKGAEIK